MKRLALYDFLRHIKRNLFVAFLMAILCLLITCFYSIYDYQYGRYEPFEKLETNDGYFVRNKTLDTGMDLEKELADLSGIDESHTVYQCAASSDIGIWNIYAYEQWVWEYWQPRLKSGKWFEESDLKKEIVPVIVCGNVEGYKVGQIFTCNSSAGIFQCVIKGIAHSGTEILWGDSFSSLEMHYDSLFTTLTDDESCIIMPKECTDKQGVEVIPHEDWLFLGFEEDLSENEKKELTESLKAIVDVGGYSYDTFIRLSKDALESKLFVYLPMMISGALLIAVSLFTVAFINVEKGGRYYSIYYLLGGSKRKCFGVSCGNVAGTVLVSGIFYILLSMVADIYCRHNDITFNISAGGRILAIILYGVFALFMLLCMYIAMRKNSPLEMLRKRK